jgi:L-arabinonolactonase
VFQIECLISADNHLGEGPIWDAQSSALYWVDGTGNRVGKPSLWRFEPKSGAAKSWSIDKEVGAMALRKNGNAILALADGFYFFDFESEELQLIKAVDAENPRTRLNDGKVDRYGRFFAGAMDDKEELDNCSLWRMDPDLSLHEMDSGIICSNGPCWSPDNKMFYFADTFKGVMWSYDYDIKTGSLSGKKEFASSVEESGLYDGATVDAEGHIWSAMVIGGELIRYAPDGMVERRIGMPVKNITSLCFGGDNLDEIYVTSMARVNHPAEHDHFAKDVRVPFAAGSLFRITGLGISGFPEPRFMG